jgi:hypothetical protein
LNLVYGCRKYYLFNMRNTSGRIAS